MKKIIMFIAVALYGSFSFAGDPTPKVLDAFNKTFKMAKNVTWNEYNNQFEVKFTQNDIRLSVVYDRNGYVVKTIRYYFEESLPILIRSKVSKKYNDASIFGVTEVSTQDNVSYNIVLQDDKHWIFVNSDSFGNLITEKKLKKD